MDDRTKEQVMQALVLAEQEDVIDKWTKHSIWFEARMEWIEFNNLLHCLEHVGLDISLLAFEFHKVKFERSKVIIKGSR